MVGAPEPWVRIVAAAMPAPAAPPITAHHFQLLYQAFGAGGAIMASVILLSFVCRMAVVAVWPDRLAVTLIVNMPAVLFGVKAAVA